jgi:3-oxoacyl-[acyl-carrier-protein] synthase II
MNDYAIVGIGLLDSLGNDWHSNWLRYLNGDVAVGPITNYDTTKYPVLKIKSAYQLDETVLDLSSIISDKERRHMDRYLIAGLYTVKQAMMQCNIVNPKNTGVFFSSLGAGAMSILDGTVNLLNDKRSTPRQCLAGQRDSLSGLISKTFGFYGLNMCLTSACASGIVSLDYAIRLLEDDVYDQIVVGGCDVMVDPRDIYMFQCIGALDTSDTIGSRPFDAARKGFVMGEGAATFIIKKVSKAKQDGDKILSIIKGIGFANESFHETAMSTDGIGARMSIDMALKKAKLDSSQINLINSHATSTPNGDEIEYNILSEYFPSSTVMAMKSNIGHTMAACGLVETAYLIKSMLHGEVGPIANLQNPIGNKLTLPQHRVTGDFKYALKNSFGFGGKSAALILERGDL